MQTGASQTWWNRRFFPQGLKPLIVLAASGTAKAVPFQNTGPKRELNLRFRTKWIGIQGLTSGAKAPPAMGDVYGTTEVVP